MGHRRNQQQVKTVESVLAEHTKNLRMIAQLGIRTADIISELAAKLEELEARIVELERKNN
jgi:septal ring factor EnvC (AmiA/AmiB activator)